jgi:hypothetical protein
MEHLSYVNSAKLISSERRPHGVTVHTIDLVYDKRLDNLSPVEAHWLKLEAALRQIRDAHA